VPPQLLWRIDRLAHGAGLRRIGAFLSLGFAILAMAAQADAMPPSAPASMAQIAVVAFNPPMDQPLTLEISDDRLLPDGSRIRFEMRYRLMFSRDEQGMVASLLMLSPACDGVARLCDAFRAALQPLSGRERRTLIGRDGDVRLLSGPQTGGDLVGDNDVGDAIDMARAQGNEVAVAEVVEALSFVGMPIADISGDGERTVLVSTDRVDVREQIALPEASGAPPMTMHKISRIDRATGLVMSSEIEVHGSGNPAPLISRRRWRLHPFNSSVS
jgi:hypothetical protein